MSEERKFKVMEAASVFISLPMTLEELTKRTDITQNEALQYFNKDLKVIDYKKYLTVQKILKFLDGYKVKKAN